MNNGKQKQGESNVVVSKSVKDLDGLHDVMETDTYTAASSSEEEGEEQKKEPEKKMKKTKCKRKR